MVKQGDFTVEIVRARTKAPFPEHSKNGQTYVEAEKDQEYYILVKSDRDDPVVAKISIDGEKLDYHFECSRNRSAYAYNGAWTRKDGKDYEYALMFKKKHFTGEEEQCSGMRDFQPGKVEVFFSEYVPKGSYSARTEDRTSEWKGGDADYVNGIIDPDEEKTVKSVLGTQFEVSEAESEMYEDYDEGRLLDTVTLYYCSAKALIEMDIGRPRGTTYDFYRENLPFPSVPVTPPPKPVPTEMNMLVAGRIQTVMADVYDLTED